MKIPSVCREERIWWENLGPHTVIDRHVGSTKFVCLIEVTRPGWTHACAVDDVFQVLSLVPAQDLLGLSTIVFRQSTRKQWLLNPVWGRLAYDAEFGRPGKKACCSGPAVLLEAVNPEEVCRWGKNLNPLEAAEIERLRVDGHILEDTGKRLLIHSSLESIRTTQLYRTLFHEIGHWVEWLERVVRPSERSSSRFEHLSDLYFARPRQERELFAHHYADALRKELLEKGHIPFPRITNTQVPHSSTSATPGEIDTHGCALMRETSFLCDELLNCSCSTVR